MHQRSLKALNARNNMQVVRGVRNTKTLVNTKTSVASIESANLDLNYKNSLSAKNFEGKLQ